MRKSSTELLTLIIVIRRRELGDRIVNQLTLPLLPSRESPPACVTRLPMVYTGTTTDRPSYLPRGVASYHTTWEVVHTLFPISCRVCKRCYSPGSFSSNRALFVHHGRQRIPTKVRRFSSPCRPVAGISMIEALTTYIT